MSNIKVHNVDEKDSKTALPAWVAIEDEKERSSRNKSSYTDVELAVGKSLQYRVQSAFPRCKTYFNIREKFLAINVKPITVRERITPEYAELISMSDKENIEVVRRGSSLIFRIKKVNS